MLNVVVCDDSDVFLQEAETALRRDTRIGEIRLYHTMEQLLKAVMDLETRIDLVLMDIEFEAEKKPAQPTHYLLRNVHGLNRPSMVILEQLKTLDKSRIIKYMGKASNRKLNDIAPYIGVSLDVAVDNRPIR